MHEPVIVHTTGDRRLEAVATTEHPASSHGLPIVLLDGEPLGPGDLLAGPGRKIEAIRAVEAADPAVRTALLRAGFVVREPVEVQTIRVRVVTEPVERTERHRGEAARGEDEP